jgi:hypothetical protein
MVRNTAGIREDAGFFHLASSRLVTKPGQRRSQQQSGSGLHSPAKFCASYVTA